MGTIPNRLTAPELVTLRRQLEAMGEQLHSLPPTALAGHLERMHRSVDQLARRLDRTVPHRQEKT